MKTIILGVTGSIAAYKAADIVSRLKSKSWDVHVVLSKNAASFITPITMQALSKNTVYTDVMQEDNPSEIVHVELAQRADILLIAPATANIIAKIAHGIADDMLTSMVLAAADIPLILAPAMNTRMYNNVATQHNLGVLRTRGWQIIEPRTARLACGTIASGALAEVDTILTHVLEAAG